MLDGMVVGGSHRPVKVLIADDNSVNRDVATGMLGVIQCETAIARDGFEAIECFKNDFFDLIFMDCQMPELDGFRATMAIRELESEKGGRIPIIALTANVTGEVKETCTQAGMDDYLSKPFSLNSLKEKVVKWAPAERRKSGVLEPNSSDSGSMAQAVEAQRVEALHSNLDARNTVLDQRVLAGLKALQVRGGSDMFSRVIKLYLDSTRDIMASLQAACRANEPQKIGQYAHALRSSSANVGALRLSGYLAELETKAQEEMLDDVKERLENIVCEYHLVVSALGEEISN
ncbi:MAG: response regulator [Pseudomonadales bacterium]|nr:response regulator [Pseudomonadales bacterium]